MTKKPQQDEQKLRTIAREAETRLKIERASVRKLPPWEHGESKASDAPAEKKKEPKK